MPLREVRDSLGVRVDAAHYADEITIITRVGKPHAVIVSYEAYQDLRRRSTELGQNLGQTSTGSRLKLLDDDASETVVDQP